MRFITIMAFLVLLIMACMAEPDSVTTGPYKVTFDLGIPKEAYKVEVEDPETKESLSGDVSTKFEINLINKTGITRRANIALTSHEIDQVIPTQDELVPMLKISLLELDGAYNVDAAARKIDGHDGAAGSATGRSSGIEFTAFTAIYYPSSTTTVTMFSAYPWDEGTLQLLRTIHVEKTNGTL
ncbi:MAG: hypothetical protein KBA97_01210 [Methanothrix sp.]|nr:hypothetical protein [Methanothrix sp.]